MACDCETETITTCEDGCPINLDFSCVLYNKDNNEVTKLTNLELTNGATLKQFAEALDVIAGQVKVSTFSLPFLRGLTEINTLKQLAQAIDLFIQQASSATSPFLGNLSADPNAPLDGQYWYNAVEQKLKMKVNGTVKTIQTV